MTQRSWRIGEYHLVRFKLDVYLNCARTVTIKHFLPVHVIAKSYEMKLDLLYILIKLNGYGYYPRLRILRAGFDPRYRQGTFRPPCEAKKR